MEHISDLAQQTFQNDDLIIYFKMYVLLYADDTVIFAELHAELQAALHGLFLYCKTWKLTVNPSKTKVVIFSKRKCTNNPTFTFGDQVLEVEDEFIYLGVSFDYKGQFFKARTRLVEQAKKASFAVIRKIRKLGLPCDIQLKLFDTMIAPILLYGSEVWGFENCDIIEAYHFKFCKVMLHLKPSTPKVMVYGELGRFPMQIFIQSRMINFWSKVVCGKEDKLSYRLYKILYYMSEQGIFQSQWLHTIRTILQKCELDYFWYNQFQLPKMDFLRLKVKQKLKELYINSWSNEVDIISKCLNYRVYKQEHKIESYLVKLSSSLCNFYNRFRCMNHRLPIEFGRFFNIERSKRKCRICKTGEIGDEYHYLFTCSFFKYDRKRHIAPYFYKDPNILTFAELMNIEDISIMTQTAIFCKKIITQFDRMNK